MKSLVINKENPKGIKKDMTEEEINAITLEIPKETQSAELKQKLADTDYISCKIADGVATREEYAEILAQRQAWRNEINKLENAEA